MGCDVDGMRFFSCVDEINVGNFFCLYPNNCSPGFVLYSQYFLY